MNSDTTVHPMKYRFPLSGETHNVLLSRTGLYKQGDNIALQLFDADDGSPFATCTVNIPHQLEKDEVAIKNYSENEGMLNFLLENDVIEEPHRFIFSGYTKIPVCRLK